MYNFFDETRTKHSTKSKRVGVLTNQPTGYSGGGPYGDMIQNRTFLKDTEIGFAEINM